MGRHDEKVRETDLYEPIRAHFVDQGFQVQAEVNDCDMVALREDEVIIIELKTSLNMTVLIQATARQGQCDGVYVGVPAPKGRRAYKTFRGATRVMKRLGLGLITVDVATGKLATHATPEACVTRANKQKRAGIVREVSGRSLSYNIGGSTRTKLMTAYREDALRIAKALADVEDASVADVRTKSGVDRSGAILYRNPYTWFARSARGRYQLTETGRAALVSYPQPAPLPALPEENTPRQKAPQSRTPRT